MASKKGASWERLVATKLSQWWTDGDRDDVFWRTQGSGARATSRAKLNKETLGQSSDIAATCSLGEPLMELLTIECKRGYSKDTIIDLLDASPSMKEQEYSTWLRKIILDSERNKSFYWMLVTKRDKRVPLIIIPWDLVESLEEVGCSTLRTRGLYSSFLLVMEEGDTKTKLWVSCLPLTRWFKCVTPDHVREVLEK